MAVVVREIMNPEVLALAPSDTLRHARRELLAMGVSGAPVIDKQRRPLGVISLRDLAAARETLRVEECMSGPAVVIAAESPIVEAARLFSELKFHRLIVVDSQGKLAGVVGPSDVLAGMIGRPALRPPAFPQLDEKGRAWSDVLPFALDFIEAAPPKPGVFVLIHGAAGIPERVVWAEACEDVRARLVELASGALNPLPAPLLEYPREHLRFRAAAVPDPRDRSIVLERLVARDRAKGGAE